MTAKSVACSKHSRPAALLPKKFATRARSGRRSARFRTSRGASQASRESLCHIARVAGIARRIDEIDAVIFQRAAEEKTIIVFPLTPEFWQSQYSCVLPNYRASQRGSDVRAVLEPQTSFAHRKPSESKEDSAAEIN